jgi:molybdate transport system ATP-binding protein
VLDVDVEVRRREFAVQAEFSVAAGERLALFGPSGAGKTTILEVVAGLLWPTRGQVRLGGRELTRSGRPRVHVPPWSRRVGLLRQTPGLFPHLSVRRNVAYSRTVQVSEPDLRAMAERLEFADLLDEHPRALSGGQAHRVALARLLLAGHDVLLLDEPYAGLDARLRRVLTDAVRDAASTRGLPSILVAHELAEAQAFADRLAVIDAGQVLQVDSPAELVRRPASWRVAELLGYQCLSAADLVDNPGGEILAVHPERTRFGYHPGEGVVLTGRVVRVRPAGTGWEVDVAVSGGAAEVTGRVADDPPPVGETCQLTVVDPPWFR